MDTQIVFVLISYSVCLILICSQPGYATTEHKTGYINTNVQTSNDINNRVEGGGRSSPGKHGVNKTADWIKKVHIVSMNHLDVGYDGIPGKQTGFINNVLYYYFHVYYPRVYQLVSDLKKGGYVETFIYTTHPWLVSMFMDCPPNFVLAGIKLQCPNVTEKAQFVQAVKDGFITWHASPMNLQPEFTPNPTLFGLSLDISAKLDKQFGITRKTKVMSQRDVPGMTKSVIPILASRGITGVTVGVNNMSPPPALPKLFRWVNNGSEVIGTWNAGTSLIACIL